MKHNRLFYYFYDNEPVKMVPGFTYFGVFAGSSYDILVKYNKKSKKVDVFEEQDSGSLIKIDEHKSIDSFMRYYNDCLYVFSLLENYDIINEKLIELN